jgi:hypothetical protein
MCGLLRMVVRSPPATGLPRAVRREGAAGSSPERAALRRTPSPLTGLFLARMSPRAPRSAVGERHLAQDRAIGRAATGGGVKPYRAVGGRANCAPLRTICISSCAPNRSCSSGRCLTSGIGTASVGSFSHLFFPLHRNPLVSEKSCPKANLGKGDVGILPSSEEHRAIPGVTEKSKHVGSDQKSTACSACRCRSETECAQPQRRNLLNDVDAARSFLIALP